MEGVVSGESHTFQTAPADVQLSGNTVTIEFVIDSLKPGMGFGEQFGASGYELKTSLFTIVYYRCLA